MSEQIISSRVNISEIDVSKLPELVEEAGALIIGGTKKGNYFVPQIVNLENIDSTIGLSTPSDLKEYTSLTANQFLRGGASSVKVLPVTNTENYTVSNAYNLVATMSGSNEEVVVAQLYPTVRGVDEGLDDITLSGSYDDFSLTMLSASVELATESNLAVDSEVAQKNFFEKFRNPKSSGSLGKYFYVKYTVDLAEIMTALGDTEVLSFTVKKSEDVSVPMSGFKNAETPYFVSQNFGSEVNPEHIRLFKFVKLSTSDVANRDTKIVISNIRTAQEVNPTNPTFGDFTVEVRSYVSKNVVRDASRRSDDEEQVLESFTCSLNPLDTNFIEKVIGTKYTYYSDGELKESGLYSNRSQFVRVVTGDLDSVPTTALPWGFEGYDTPADYFASASPTFYATPTTNTMGGVDFNKWYVDFLHKELPLDTFSFYTTASDDDRYVLPSASAVTSLSSSLRKFQVGFYGGTKGVSDVQVNALGEDISANNVVGFDLSDSEAAGFASYKRALDIIADPEVVDFKILFMPAVNMVQHPSIINYALNILESRGDAILFIDAGAPTSSMQDVINSASALDSSYGAAFDPWLLNAQNVLIPPTVAFANAVANNDTTYKPWYTMLGIERGQIFGVNDVVRKYNLESRDRLVQNRINPIGRYGNRIVIYGQKSLQQKDTMLQLYPIRRLLIEAKRSIKLVAGRVIGKQMTDSLINQFESEINQILQNLKEMNGVSRFKVVFDRSRDAFDRGVIDGQVVLQPVLGVNGVNLTFKLSNQGVDFQN